MVPIRVFLFCCVLVLTAVPGRAADAIRLYVAPDGNDANPGTAVAPFATLQRAQQAVRALRSVDGRPPATVYLRGGEYSLDAPLVFTSLDSGAADAPVTWEAYPAEEPLVTGGRRIQGWERSDDGRWRVQIPEVAGGDWYFNQLYVNGELRHRARIPNEGFLRVAGHPCGARDVHYHTDCDRFGFAAGDIDPDWKNLDDVEVIVYHFWTDSHLPIKEIDEEDNIVIFEHEAGKVFTDDFTDGGARYIVENVWEGLDAPGEWYLDRTDGMLYYIPMPGENMLEAEVIAPVIPEFMRFEGDPMSRDYVEHITFRGITFSGTNWQLPPGNSNDRQGSASVPAAITLVGARNIHFDGNHIKNTGTWAFDVREGCSENLFTHNELSYLAAGGIRVGGGDEEEPPLMRAGNNLIADNHLHHYGEVYPSAVGILLMHTNGNAVVHNHIHHGYYTGISIGWEWGYQRSVSRDNVVAYNHIHDIGQGLLSDMGAIYTLGVSPGTVIRGNLIHDVDSNHYGGWGIYNDEGSTHHLIEDNIVYNTKFGGYNIHFAKEITLRNNIIADSRIELVSRSRVEPHQSVFMENNIFYWTDGKLLGGNWSDEPYTFHFHPKNESGTREVSQTFESDWNLYYNPTLTRDEVRFGDETWQEWQARGKDVHSMYADPMFRDPGDGDFSIAPESPVWGLGFREIDISKVGPRERKAGGAR